MNRELTQECMRLLKMAKQGDEGAHRTLVNTVSSAYKGMVEQFYTTDPILGREDIQCEFYWGIWRAVAIVDGRGDPIFHLAQRGQWAVKSLVTAVNKRRHGTTEKEGGVSVVSLDGMWHEEGDGARVPDWEPADESVVSNPHSVVEIKEDKSEAHQRVLRILVRADLAPRHQEILQMLLTEDIDLNEKLARKRLAEKLGVSGQRVTQLLNGLEKKMHAADGPVSETGTAGDVLAWISEVETAAVQKPLVSQLARL